jgi:amino acid adenylation domain-containing protein
VHHIVNDAVSHQILQNEITAFLQGKSQGKSQGKEQGEAAKQLPTPIPYREFIAYTLEQAKNNDAKQYFSQVLADVSQSSAPFGLSDVQGDGSNIIELRHSLNAEVSQQIKQLSRHANISGAAFFHAVWALVVGAFSGRDDVVFGTVLSGRLQGMINAGQMPGVFINTLPLRVKFSGLSAGQLVTEVNQSLHGLIPHEQASLALAQRCSLLPADQPLFSAMLNYRHGINDKSDAVVNNAEEEVEATFEYLGKEERSNYPFTLGVTDHQQAAFDLSLKVADSIDAKQVLQCLEYTVQQLAQALTEQSDSLVAQINVYQHYEIKHQPTSQPTSQPQTHNVGHFCQRFESLLATHGESTALLWGEARLTYAQLDAKATVLSHHLRQQGVAVGDKVGLCLHRSVNMIISIIAILKAGGAYVPLDPAQPNKRTEFMIADSQIKLVVTQTSLSERFVLNKLSIDDAKISELLLADTTDLAYLPLPNMAHLPAYIIYTSGTTGQPKGVLTSHQNLANFHLGFQAQMQVLGSSAQNPWLWHTTFAFDASVKGLSLLFAGKAMVMASDEQSRDPQALVELIQQHQVDVFGATPMMVEQVLERLVEQGVGVNLICGGEDISKTLWHKLADYGVKHQVNAINAYGPTETTVNACFAVISAQDEVNMGLPMANTRFYLLNEQLQAVPPGVQGELYISGDSVSSGYLNREDATKAHFITLDGQRLYRSGDMVRQLADGRFVYMGRKDKQIKLRGYRIEITEIEYQLNQRAEITQAVVLLQPKTSGEPHLVAYLVLAKGANEPSDISSVLTWLRGDYLKRFTLTAVPCSPVNYCCWPIILSLMGCHGVF